MYSSKHFFFLFLQDNHIYYKSTIIQDAVDEHWVDFGDSVNAHKVLSDSHRMAAVSLLRNLHYLISVWNYIPKTL